MKKPPLLFLCHRIPFPPNKGDKIRSFNMLKVLSEHFDVYLGSFVDDPYDWQFTAKLDDYCKEVYLLNQNKLYSKVKGLRAFITGKSISEKYYQHRKMQRWVDNILADKNIENVFIYSSVMALFTQKHIENIHQVVDFVDVDSDKWRQYALSKSGLSKWVYAREHLKLQQFENKVASHSAHSIFVSGPEGELFKQQIPGALHSRVIGLLNGVDVDYFDPDAKLPAAELPDIDVVFTGAMDYWANVDAVLWFAKHVWPIVRTQIPQATFYVVGGNPTAQVNALHGKHGITVTGRVKDVRTYIKQGKVSVAPLQIARGIQNKVLEAMAMAKPVVATSMAIEGIDARTDSIDICDSAQDYADHVCKRIENVVQSADNREWILNNVRWSETMGSLPRLFRMDA
ncbi:MAG: TIGR03087 family PEP-CTERM/XrtA system glycosyltransferase [Aliiglaciecola sp.]